MKLPDPIQKNPFQYLFLAVVFALFAVSFFVFAYDPHLQRRLVYAVAAFYFAWSIYHHYKRGDLEVSIVIEYLLFGLFAIVIVSSTFF
jgi:hypothetical protein